MSYNPYAFWQAVEYDYTMIAELGIYKDIAITEVLMQQNFPPKWNQSLNKTR